MWLLVMLLYVCLCPCAHAGCKPAAELPSPRPTQHLPLNQQTPLLVLVLLLLLRNMTCSGRREEGRCQSTNSRYTSHVSRAGVPKPQGERGGGGGWGGGGAVCKREQAST
jgi:hypothetical protein